MKTFRMNAVMAGIFYFLGTVFGVSSAIFGGELISSLVTMSPISGTELLDLITTDSTRLNTGAFFVFLMGVSLTAMTVFLYPVLRRDSEELALGMLLFRGALEGVWYLLVALNLLALYAIGTQYSGDATNAESLRTFASVLYQYQDLLGPVGSMVFLIGATCLYVSLYRTRLIPRWLTLWGLVGVVLFMAFALLHFFHMDNGIGFYLQMVLAPQEIVMALWLVIKGFDKGAVAGLNAKAAAA